MANCGVKITSNHKRVTGRNTSKQGSEFGPQFMSGFQGMWSVSSWPHRELVEIDQVNAVILEVAADVKESSMVQILIAQSIHSAEPCTDHNQ